MVLINSKKNLEQNSPINKRIIPIVEHVTSAAKTDSVIFLWFFSPIKRATTTLTPFPSPIKKPVNSDTKIVVDPTAPKDVFQHSYYAPFSK